MQVDQRGAKEGCSGTIETRSHALSGQPKRRMGCIDVRKANDSVDHQWLRKILTLHRFPEWIGKVVCRLSSRWNTRIVARTKQGVETYDHIRFKRGLPQGDALYPRLFMLSINPVSWKLKAREGFKLSKPINMQATHRLFVDDLKIYVASKGKLQRVMRSMRD